MGLNFYYYDGLQPKMSAGMINEHECSSISFTSSVKFEYVDSFLVGEFEIYLSCKWKLLHIYYSAISFELKL
jgi:hypothetical protein